MLYFNVATMTQAFHLDQMHLVLLFFFSNTSSITTELKKTNKTLKHPAFTSIHAVCCRTAATVSVCSDRNSSIVWYSIV